MHFFPFFFGHEGSVQAAARLRPIFDLKSTQYMTSKHTKRGGVRMPSPPLRHVLCSIWMVRQDPHGIRPTPWDGTPARAPTSVVTWWSNDTVSPPTVRRTGTWGAAALVLSDAPTAPQTVVGRGGRGLSTRLVPYFAVGKCKSDRVGARDLAASRLP